MSYKRVVKKKGKTYGPYLYESYRDKYGNVQKKYLGKYVEQPKKPFILPLILIILFGLTCYSFFNSPLTGKVTLSLDNLSIEEQTLKGNMVFTLQQSEFIPAETQVIISNSGKEYSYSLREIIEIEEVLGTFFIKDITTFTGDGPGFGSSSNLQFPLVYFVLGIYEESEEEGKTYTIPVEPVEDNESVEEIQEQIPDEEIIGETSVEEIPEEENQTESGQRSISGNVISNFFYSLTGKATLELIEEINGQVRANESFVYDLEEGKTAQIISSDEGVDLAIENNQVIITTEYFGDESLEISIPLDELNVSIEEGDLEIRFVYDGEELFSGTTQIILDIPDESDEGSIRELPIEPEPSQEEINETEPEINETIPEPEVNETINETEEINETEILDQIRTIQMGGDGTLGNPFQITTCDELNQTRNNLTASYKLMNNINFNSCDSSYTTGLGWLPIGNATSGFQFTGTFDGQNYIISNLFINRTTTYNGLFGYINGTTINNLTLEDINIISTVDYTGGLVGRILDSNLSNINISGTIISINYVGGLVGQISGSRINNSNTLITLISSGTTGRIGGLIGESYYSTINNSRSKGLLNASANSIGGLIGIAQYTQLEKSYSTVDVNVVSGTERSYIGGLVGNMSYSNISRCYSIGNVLTTNAQSVGGLIGTAHRDNNIDDSYSRGNITANYYGASLIGRFYQDNLVNRSYATGNVNAGATSRGINSWNAGSGNNVYNSFWDYQTTGTLTTSSAGGELRNNFDMRQESNYVDWDFDNTWDIAEEINCGYPTLEGMSIESAPCADIPTLIKNITNCAELQQVKNYLDEDFILMNNIDCSDTVNWNSGQGFIPLNEGTVVPFTGTFDGRGYNITNLFINRTTDYNGLFGYTLGAEIKNVNLQNISIINTGSYTGGLIGKSSNTLINDSNTLITLISSDTGGIMGGLIGHSINNTVISYSSSNGLLNVSGTFTGGLIGLIEYSEIYHSHSAVSINVAGSHPYIGGLIGNMTYSNISRCSSIGNVSAPSSTYVGGLIGNAEQRNGVYDSYSRSRVSANNWGAGLIGRFYQYDNVNRTYATGNITSSNAKGLVGYIYGGNNAVLNSFWDNETTGTSTSSGGGTGLPTLQMKNQTIFTDAGWDFTRVWNISASVNDGYPNLILKDSSPPIILLTSPPDDGIVGNLRNPLFKFNVTDDLAEDLLCTLLIDGEPYGTTYVNLLEKNFSQIYSNQSLSDGTYEWWINCSDGINMGMSEKRTFDMNFFDLNINLVSPTGTINVLQGDIFNSIFNISCDSIYNCGDINVSPINFLGTNVNLSQFGRVIYVDAENGDDTSGDGSLLNPYQTINEAYAHVNGNNNEAVYLRKGVYDYSLDGVWITRSSIIGEGKDTILLMDHYERDVSSGYPGISSCSITSSNVMYGLCQMKFYDLVFQVNYSDTYANMFGGSDCKFYNIVFKLDTPATIATFTHHDNMYFENCIDYTGVDKMIRAVDNDVDMINCYGRFSPNIAYTLYSDYDMYTSNVGDSIWPLNVDSNYNINGAWWINSGTGENPDGSQANIGVYGGNFSWVVESLFNKITTNVSQIPFFTNASSDTISINLNAGESELVNFWINASANSGAYFVGGRIETDTEVEQNSKSFTVSIEEESLTNFTNATNTSVNFETLSNFTANISIYDGNGLDYYRFYTNASGNWTNKTININGTEYNASETALIELPKGSNVCWYYWANDTSYSGREANSSTYCFNVRNSKPVITSPPILNSSLGNNGSSENLTCYADINDTYDINGDNVTLIYAWHKNGVLQSGLTSNLLDSSYTSFDEVWKCNVTPYDEEEYGISQFSNNLTILKTVEWILSLNGTDDDIYIDKGESVLIEVNLSEPSTGNLTLYKEGVFLAKVINGNYLTYVSSGYDEDKYYNITVIFEQLGYNPMSLLHWVIAGTDNLAPVVNLTEPFEQEWIKGDNISGANQTFVYEVDDNYKVPLNCSLYINEVFNQSDSNVSVGVDSYFEIYGLSEGTNQTWNITCFDSLLNVGSAMRTFNVDLNPPTSEILFPLNNSTLNTPNPEITINLTDNLAEILDYIVYVNNTINTQGTEITNNTLTNITLNSLHAGGNYTIMVEAEDYAGNKQNSSSITIFINTSYVDIISPIVGYSSNQSTLNLTFVYMDDLYSEANCTGYLNNTIFYPKTTISSNTPVTFLLENATQGRNMPLNVTCQTPSYTRTNKRTITIDYTSPTYTNISTNPVSPAGYSEGLTNFEIIVIDNVLANQVVMTHNFTGSLVDVVLSGIGSKQKTFDYYYHLPIGSYTYMYWMNDTLGNSNSTGWMNYSVVIANTSLSLEADPNWNTQYNYTTISCTANHNESEPNLFLNGENVSNPYTTLHAVGTYNYSCNISATENYTYTEVSNILNISKLNSDISIIASPSWNPTYRQTQVTCYLNHEYGTPSLFLNGTNVSNPYITTHAVGTYNYSCNISESENYTSDEKYNIMNVSRRAPEISLTADPGWRILPSESANITCSVDNDQTNISLYRDGFFLGSSLGGSVSDYQDNLLDAVFIYTCNSSETENYTSKSVNKTFYANPYNGRVDLHVTPDWDTTYGATSVSCTANHEQATPTLFLEGINVSNPHVTTFAVGTYNYSCNISETIDYTSDETSHLLEISKADPEIDLSVSPGLIITPNNTANVTCSVNNNQTNITLYRNGELINSSLGGLISDINNFSSGSHIEYTCNSSETQNYTSTSESANLTVKYDNWCNLSFVPSSVDFEHNFTVYCSCINNETSAQLYRKGVNVSDEINQTIYLPVGSYSYICNSSETDNFYRASNSSTYVVTKRPGQINLTLNGSSENITINEGESLNISAYMIEPTSGYIYIYETREDKRLIWLGQSPVSLIRNFSGKTIPSEWRDVYRIDAEYKSDDNYSLIQSTLYVTLLDITPPIISLRTPSNNSWMDYNGLYNFTYRVAENRDTYLNCSLYINDTLNQTQFAKNSRASFSDPTNIFELEYLEEGLNQTWMVSCIDESNNTGNSSYLLNVDFTSPIAEIVWPSPNITTSDSTPMITVNLSDELSPTLNYKIYVNGELNKGGEGIINSELTNITLNTVSRGINYVKIMAEDLAGNKANSSEVLINLSGDIIFLESPEPDYWSISNNMNFTFNFSSIHSVMNCSLYLDDVLTQTNESVSEGVNTSFEVENISDKANITWEVICVLDSDPSVNASQSRLISIDSTPPIFINHSVEPVSGMNYSDEISVFIANFSDNVWFNTSFIEHNFSGEVEISPMNCSGNLENKTCQYSQLIDVGNYSYRFIGEDHSGFENTSEWFNYTVNRGPALFSFLLNGNDSDAFIHAGDNVTILVQFLAPNFGSISVTEDDSTFVGGCSDALGCIFLRTYNTRGIYELTADFYNVFKNYDITSGSHLVYVDKNATQDYVWNSIIYPEGIYEPYFTPYSPSANGTRLFDFEITFANLTVQTGDEFSCLIEQSNGNIIDVRNSSTEDIEEGSFSITYHIASAENVSRDIPWKIINCSSYRGGNLLFSDNESYNLAYHNNTANPKPILIRTDNVWTQFDNQVDDAFLAGSCFLGQVGSYFDNTLKCDYAGDVAFAASLSKGFDMERICDDGIDNDGDGLIDCEDRYCQGISYSCQNHTYVGEQHHNSCTNGLCTSTDVVLGGKPIYYSYNRYIKTGETLKVRFFSNSAFNTNKAIRYAITDLKTDDYSTKSGRYNNALLGTYYLDDFITTGQSVWASADGYAGVVDFVIWVNLSSSPGLYPPGDYVFSLDLTQYGASTLRKEIPITVLPNSPSAWDESSVGEGRTSPCMSNVDEDLDYFTSCADSDCWGIQGGINYYLGGPAYCSDHEICDDGFDNDRDGKTDCEYSGCNLNISKPFPELPHPLNSSLPIRCHYNGEGAVSYDTSIYDWISSCSDDFNNDAQGGFSSRILGVGGNVDCWDQTYCWGRGETSTTLPCPRYENNTAKWCFDGYDNNYDGLIDCQNPECAGEEYIVDADFLATYNSAYYVSEFNRTPNLTEYITCSIEPINIFNETDELRCFDGIDNDFDSDKDCRDSDCWGLSNGEIICVPYEFNLTTWIANEMNDTLFTNLSYCIDTIDNDGDIPIDCRDDDCKQQFGYCGPCPTYENYSWFSCSDGADSNHNNLIDCKDSECLGKTGSLVSSQLCTSTEICNDSFDNNRDGSTDCQSSNCWGSTGSYGEVCAQYENTNALCQDGYDNNGNGLIDCLDSSCWSTSVCHSSWNVVNNLEVPYTPTGFSRVGTTSIYYRSLQRHYVNTNYVLEVKGTAAYYGSIGINIGDKLGVHFPYSTACSLSGDTGKIKWVPQSGMGQLQNIGTVTGGFSITLTCPGKSSPVSNPAYLIAPTNELAGGSSENGAASVSTTVYEHDAPSITDVEFSSYVSGIVEVKRGNSISIRGIPTSDIHYISQCTFSLTGPGGYSSGSVSSNGNCVYTFPEIITSGSYTICINARDGVSNTGSNHCEGFTIRVLPIVNSSGISNYDAAEGIINPLDYHAFFNSSKGGNVEFESVFLSSVSKTINTCTAYLKNSTGSVINSKSISVSPSESVNCDTFFALSGLSEGKYTFSVIATDNQGETVSSGDKLFFNCPTYGDVYEDCILADFDGDGYRDVGDPILGTCDFMLGIAGMPVCGDGIVDTGEECDLTNLSGETCITKGFESGTLACSINCTFDNSSCVGAPAPSPEPGPGGGGGTGGGGISGAAGGAGGACTPNCTEKECGDDGCNGNCGECGEGYECVNYKCVIIGSRIIEEEGIEEKPLFNWLFWLILLLCIVIIAWIIKRNKKVLLNKMHHLIAIYKRRSKKNTKKLPLAEKFKKIFVKSKQFIKIKEILNPLIRKILPIIKKSSKKFSFLIEKIKKFLSPRFLLLVQKIKNILRIKFRKKSIKIQKEILKPVTQKEKSPALESSLEIPKEEIEEKTPPFSSPDLLDSLDEEV